jgi:hypothetical protein
MISHEKSLYANLTLDEVKEVAGDGDSITSLQVSLRISGATC